MRPRAHELIAAILVAGMATSLVAQDDDAFRRVELRVTSSGPGSTVTVDRGERDRVALGDVVLFYPRAGGIHRGSVVRLDDRSAAVELHAPDFVPEPGTRGEVLIPRTRDARTGEPAADPRERPPDRAGGDEPPERGGERPRFQNRDEGFSPDMPLLAQVKSVRPEQRPMQFSGRVYGIGELTHTSEDGFSNSLARVGTDLQFDNPFGRGGSLSLDTELNYKTELDDDVGLDLLARRASYSWGGTRFAASRWEIGRFLQHGIPEFGVLDGFEWSRRRANGDRFGASVGFMPEPDDDFDSLRDFQVAAHYLWVADEAERLTLGGGFQKTLHDGKTDRDLLVGKLRYLPLEGWSCHGTVWVDFYHGRDDIKGKGVEVTQALASVSRRFENGDFVDLTYRRIRFPEILRNGEFLPVLQNELANNRYDRLSLSGWMRWSEDTRLHGVLSGWDDEDDDGAAAEAGVEIQDLFYDKSRADLTAFGNLSEFQDTVGGRLAYGRSVENGRWDLFYEFAHHDLAGFTSDRDDLLQHRLRVSRSLDPAPGFSVTLHAEVGLWDDEWSWSVGAYSQKVF